MRNGAGFTVPELLVILIVAGIAAIFALRTYQKLAREAQFAEESGLSLQVRAGIENYFVDPAKGNKIRYPEALDTVRPGVCTRDEPCFSKVVPAENIAEGWVKLTPTTYRSRSNYTNVWTYDPASGGFFQSHR